MKNFHPSAGDDDDEDAGPDDIGRADFAWLQSKSVDESKKQYVLSPTSPPA